MDPVPPSSLDAEAFLRLLMAEQRTLFRFILRYLPAVVDARDVLQETLITLWAKRAEFDAAKEFLPWACGIARFKVREFWRKQPRWELFAEGDLMTLIDARRDVLEPELALRRVKLAECLKKLPAGQRAILNRYYSEEESTEALALREGRSVDAIYKLLQRVRRELLQCIARALRAEGACG